MKDLIGKAESMMNVILLFTVALAWTCFSSFHDPVFIGARLYSEVYSIHEDERSGFMTAFLNAVNPVNKDGKREKVSREVISDKLRNVSIEEALAISGDRRTSPAVVKAATLARELEAMRVRSGKTNTLTFEEFSKDVNPPTKLPFTDAELNSKVAVFVLTGCLAGPFIYLLSLMSAIEVAIRHEDYHEGATWLFFHPWTIGSLLGSLWMLAPSLAISASAGRISIDRDPRVGCVVFLVIVAAFPLVRAWQLRKAFRNRINQGKKK